MLSSALFPVLFSGSLDPDVVAWRSAVTANGGSVSGGVVAQVSRFVRGCKADGVWDSLLEVCLFSGVDNLNAALVKLKTPSDVQRVLTNVNFVEADYVSTGASAGLSGNKTSKYLNTGLTPVGRGMANNSTQGFYQTRVVTASSLTGAGENSGKRLNMGLSTVSTSSNMYNLTTGSLAYLTATTGFTVASRVSSASHVIYKNGVNVASNATSGGTITDLSYFLFAWNANATPSNYGDQRDTFFFIGTGLTDTQVAALSSRLNTLMAGFGCNTY